MELMVYSYTSVHYQIYKYIKFVILAFNIASANLADALREIYWMNCLTSVQVQGEVNTACT